ncbi:serine/threonine protein kinase [Myxococcus stipitatus]|uniref:serine/threonine protein kinase n=1 Tax=Myxococcus stipitatus TaxID=83455 RepID=UPI0030CF49B9
MSTVPTESSRFLGRYELVHPLGQGGMGEVFLAKISGAAGFEKPCIVKTILPALLKDRQFLDRFHHEAKVLVHLVHSSIAQVYDMGEADGTYYMALEYVAGVDLAYLLEQVRQQGVQVPVPVALFLGQRMAEGLGYAHRKVGPDGVPLGIVHRDVSPHNVMVSYEGEVKVIDFGLAKSAARSKYTLPATVMGKLGYMSPEQVRAEALDHRSDIYSCGVVMWEMLAGRSLIPHGTVGEMMAAMSQPSVPTLTGLRGDVDAALDGVVRRALAAKPDERYSRADELARALNGELVRSGAAVGAEEVGHFVRALCPEAFAAQRQLISKVTSSGSHHRTPTPQPLPGSGTGTGMYGTGPQAGPGGTEPSGFEPTMMRPPSGERRMPGVARPDAPAGEDAMATEATAVRASPGALAGGANAAAPAGATPMTSPAWGTPVPAPANAGSPAWGTPSATPVNAGSQPGATPMTSPAWGTPVPAPANTTSAAQPGATPMSPPANAGSPAWGTQVPAPASSASPSGATPVAAPMGGMPTASHVGATAASRSQPHGAVPHGEVARSAPMRKTSVALLVVLALLLMAGTAATTLYFARRPANPPAVATTSPASAPAQREEPKQPTSPQPRAQAGTPPNTGKKPGTPEPSGAKQEPEQVATRDSAAQGSPKPEQPTTQAPASQTSTKPAEPEHVATREPVQPKRPTTPPAPKSPKSTSESTPPASAQPASTKLVTYVSPTAVLPLQDEAGGYVVRGAQAALLQRDMVVQVVGPAKNGQRVLLGRATVSWAALTPRARRKVQLARLSLDASAQAATGARFIALPGGGGPEVAAAVDEEPASEPEAPQVAPEPPKPAAPKTLVGTVRAVTGLKAITSDEVLVRNLDEFAWTDCYVVKGLRQTARLGIVLSQKERPAKNFKDRADFLVERGKVGVFCKEGQFITTLR